MVMKARSTSFASGKFSSRTSTSTTSIPSERSALETPRPVASETFLSDPGPPINTATFFGKSSFFIMSVRLGPLSWFSDDLHFRLQFDSAFRFRLFLNSIDQLQHFRRGRAAIVDNKIAVHLRDARFADCRIF